MYKVLADYQVNGKFDHYSSDDIEGFNEANARFLQKVSKYSRLIAQLAGKNYCRIELRDYSSDPCKTIQSFTAQAPQS